MEIKMNVWLANSGVEAMAKKEELKAYHLSVQGVEYDMATEGWVLIKEVAVQVEIPEVEYVIPAAVGAMRRAVTEFRAKAESKARDMEAQIENLLAIGYSA